MSQKIRAGRRKQGNETKRGKSSGGRRRNPINDHIYLEKGSHGVVEPASQTCGAEWGVILTRSLRSVAVAAAAAVCGKYTTTTS